MFACNMCRCMYVCICIFSSSHFYIYRIVLISMYMLEEKAILIVSVG